MASPCYLIGTIERDIAAVYGYLDKLFKLEKIPVANMDKEEREKLEKEKQWLRQVIAARLLMAKGLVLNLPDDKLRKDLTSYIALIETLYKKNELLEAMISVNDLLDTLRELFWRFIDTCKQLASATITAQ